MRLTKYMQVARKQFRFKTIWENKQKTVVKKLDFRPALATLGVKAVDPLKDEDFFGVKEHKVWIPPDDPRFMFPPLPEDHVDYHPSQAYTLDDTIKLWEGLPQAQVLTNTVVERGLPADVFTISDQFSSPNQDHLMQRTILQANLWDTARVKMPKREQQVTKVWKYKTEFGIPDERNVEIMYHGIAQRCFQLLALKQPSLVKYRRLLPDHRMNTHYTFDNLPIYLTSHSHCTLTSSNPLSRFANKEQVLATKDQAIQSIWPISPFVDLKKSHIYKRKGSLGYTADYKYPHHHTLLLVHNNDWTMEQRHGSALLMSYAHCLQLAHHHNNADSLMKEPICIQTVHTDGRSFGYTCFQLNTLETSLDDGGRAYGSRRNMVWIDDDTLFKKDIPKRSMLRDTKYSEYNPDVFRKILGLFAR